MYQHISITMSQQTQLMLQANAAYPQLSSLYQLVDIISHSNAYHHIVFSIYLLNKSLMPSMSKASVKRRV